MNSIYTSINPLSRNLGPVSLYRFLNTPTTLTPTLSILHKSIAGHYRPVRVADEPITARCRFIKNASCDRHNWDGIMGNYSIVQVSEKLKIYATWYTWQICLPLYMGDNFCDFLFAFLQTKFLLKTMTLLQWQNLLLTGANAFLLT